MPPRLDCTHRRIPARLSLLGGLALALCSCGPDETLALFPGGGGAGAGGGSGSGGNACALHSDCGGPAPWCDRADASCSSCPEGLVQCGGECVDTARDPRHCGGCFGACGTGEVCDASECQCSGSTVECGGACVDTHVDPAHCGGCDHPCDDPPACDGGKCHSSCGPGHTACNVEGGIACIDLMVGPRCGSCEITCGSDETCVAGSCRAIVPASPCTTCPCDDVCHAAFGDAAACCEGVHGDDHATCVAGGACP
ncbi:MAG: hypothetical protein JNK04_04330 [Myxococcales bacterium]|nr:hypothetical protein [Myxococcales bacterium]